MGTYINNARVLRSDEKKDIFVENGVYPFIIPNNIDPTETFPVRKGTVMAMSSVTKLIVRYVNGGTNGAGTPIGMLYEDAIQPADILLYGGSPIAIMASVVRHGIAFVADDYLNMDSAAKTALALLGLYVHTPTGEGV